MKRLICLFVAVGLVRCATPPKPLPKPNGESANPYFQYYNSHTSDFDVNLPFTPWELFTRARPVFESSLTKRVQNDGTLQSFSGDLVIHGDFHPLQIAYAKDVPSLQNSNSVRTGPFWHDLVRMETGAQILAFQQSLRQYKSGACLDAYAKTLQNIVQGNPTSQLGSLFPPEALPLIKTADIKNELLWKEAKGDIPTPLESALEDAVPSDKLDDLKKLAPKHRLFITESYLGITPHKKVWEFRGASLTNDKSTIKSCEPSLSGLLIYQPQMPSKCFLFNGKPYFYFEWPETFRPFRTSFFNSDASLTNHVSWMCQQLAKAHAKQFTSNRLRELDLLLTQNKTFLKRLNAYSNEETELALVAYRRILEK